MVRLIGYALAVALTLPSVAAERAAVPGFPIMHVIPEKQQSAGSQVFSIAQRSDGTLFFGGLAGIASYDGAWWRSVTLPNDSAAFAVAASARGPEVAAGGIGQFGWVASDTNGALVYHSLVEQLPASQRDIGEVRSICATASGFLYSADRALVVWNGGTPRVIAALHDSVAPRCFSANGRTWVALAQGLHRLDGDRLARAGFDDKLVELLVPMTERSMLVAIANEGLFAFDGATSTPFAPEATEWLRGKQLTSGCRLQDGRIVIGTRQDGALLLDANGAIVQRLDGDAGLPRDVLNAAMADREGSLWLAYDGPLARVDLASPLSIIDGRAGIRGSIATVERHRDRLYAGGSHGLFVMGGAIRRIASIPPPVWEARSIGDELLVLTGNGFYVLRDDESAQLIDGTRGLTAYHASRSPSDASTIWVASKKGPGKLRRDANGWRFEGLLAQVPYTRTIYEVNGALWCGTVFDGMLRIDPRTRRVERFSSGELSVTLIGGEIRGARDGAIVQPASGGRLLPDPRFTDVRGDFFHVLEDTRGNLWFNSAPPQLLPRLRDGHYAAQTTPLVSADSGRPQIMVALGDDVWFSGYASLFRYDLGAATAAYAQPRPIIGRVSVANAQQVNAPLPSSFGRLRIEFGPASYRPGVAYQYRLDPIDETWSAWTTEAAIDYTNLEDGNYTFRVRARGAAGQPSDEARWMFSVLPPWYRTRGAIALWFVLAALLVAAIVRLRTRALRRQATRLRALIDEKTEELLQANAHLERLSLLDDLTGIANRRYFQRALVEDWRSAHAEGQPLALVLLDLDHFKQLNDQQGHPAGDAALVQVGRYLARVIRRSGELGVRMNDLVARIGGEEFAVLLMRTDEAEALRVAETLRNGIEQLPIGITASCGVAAFVPRDNESWDTLMGEADRALYAAKTAGRNRVQAASSCGAAPFRAPASAG